MAHAVEHGVGSVELGAHGRQAGSATGNVGDDVVRGVRVADRDDPHTVVVRQEVDQVRLGPVGPAVLVEPAAHGDHPGQDAVDARTFAVALVELAAQGDQLGALLGEPHSVGAIPRRHGDPVEPADDVTVPRHRGVALRVGQPVPPRLDLRRRGAVRRERDISAGAVRAGAGIGVGVGVGVGVARGLGTHLALTQPHLDGFGPQGNDAHPTGNRLSVKFTKTPPAYADRQHGDVGC
ncbi:hypothetical protein BJF85_05795 [Saccharomonospora sp. CUA-673]|uniref:hypothetical protein n=1 Tax=Saccharomonospora sp. CUA-673 TaxID=1904969 RepID=UPI0009591E2B|nr:hypothetical protein [Saccharomonospora sp. CUA-673]OLT40650.1 hypothetical protein BJF85_05795 [Saccharomonospora sp. CUA-673]